MLNYILLILLIVMTLITYRDLKNDGKIRIILICWGAYTGFFLVMLYKQYQLNFLEYTLDDLFYWLLISTVLLNWYQTFSKWSLYGKFNKTAQFNTLLSILCGALWITKVIL